MIIIRLTFLHLILLLYQNLQNDGQSYDLWLFGCLLWSHQNFKNNSEFFEFLGSTHLTPTIPINLSKQCQELIKILFNYSLTIKPNIYNILLNLDFFKYDAEDFSYNNMNKKVKIKTSFEGQGIIIENDDMN